MSHYRIKCRKCSTVLDDAFCAFCEHCRDSLLVTEYRDGFAVEKGVSGVWRYNWLPVHSPGFYQPGPVVYRSRGLAGALGLDDLYIAFNGYWPEQGAEMTTCTFKEFEAAVVLENARSNTIEGMVVASAGNTARAFAHLSTVTGFPVIIVVPQMCLFEMWYLEASLSIPTIALEDGDYSDAIDLAKRMALAQGYPFEGGVKNIAKRDGLGIVLLETVERVGKLPDRYFQAVGSGTGAIAVWEMSERFLRDGRYGRKHPVLHLAQNLPFAPMVKAWDMRSRTLFQEDLRPELIEQITTRVISTRYPAYSVQGGVFDALTATDGRMYGIENDDVYAAVELFEKTEGIDIVLAAGVAVAALQEAVKEGHVDRKDTILLNITGGGEKRLRQEIKTHRVKPVFLSKAVTDAELEELLCSILKNVS
ncbi:MAG: cysteate synthase [Nitrospiraceae bacterium]|nr:MAG: cysteate synthase [Nitrospiraceae bacterium]